MPWDSIDRPRDEDGTERRRKSRRRRNTLTGRRSTDLVNYPDHVEVYPRDEENRYRIYAVMGNDRTILATTPTAGGIGQAIVQIHDDQKAIGRRLDDLGRIGVLDVMPNGEPAPRGEWIVNPYPISLP